MADAPDNPAGDHLPHHEPVSFHDLLATAKIELCDVHRDLDGRKILDGVSLRIRGGETLCILGGSGAGKSVTLKHIVGLMKPDSGKILVDGTDVVRADSEGLSAIRKKIGYLFQGAALLNSLTIDENIALPLREHENLPEGEIRDRVAHGLEMVHLEEAGSKFPSQLSGGMKKRAGLARAIIREPEIILYDEPTAGLDPVIAATINDLILEMQNRLGVTSILVTHDMSSCFKVSDRIAMLVKGRIHRTGTPDEMKAAGDPVVDQFIYGDSEGPLTREPKR